MADFAQAMKDWRRMCKFSSDTAMDDGRHGCVDMCPLGHNKVCGEIELATDREIEDAAKAIAQWAAEHPEPKFPTWREWLTEIGAIHEDCSDYGVGSLLRQKSVPAGIAQKLGIEPKEG